MSLLSRFGDVRAVQPLRFREYRLLFTGQVFGTMGMWMDEVTRLWLIYQLTDSMLQLGLVRGVQAVPYLVFSSLAGTSLAGGGAPVVLTFDPHPASILRPEQAPLPLKRPAQPTKAEITAEDLMSRLYVFSDDSMQGRQTGTDGHRKGTDYIAAEAQRMGLKPAGDNGTFFQAVPVFQRALDVSVVVRMGLQYALAKGSLQRLRDRVFAAMARNAGSVTRQCTMNGRAPRLAAALARSGSSPSSAAPMPRTA